MIFFRADVIEKLVEKPTDEYVVIPLHCVSLPGYTYKCVSKITDIRLQTLQDKDLILLLENIVRGGISSVMGDRYVKSDDENEKIFHIDATIL